MSNKITDLIKNVQFFASELVLKKASKDHGFFICSSKFNGKEIHMKMGKDSYKRFIQKEINVNKKLKGVTGFPRLLFIAETADGTAIIVTEKLGNSLHDIHISKPRKFDINTIAMIGISVTYRLEALHKNGIVHGSICPMNIISGMKRTQTEYELFLINFENSTQYICETAQSKTSGFMTGDNIDFASKAYHRTCPQNPKDDFESLFYTLAFLKNGTLPWSNIPKRTATDWKRIGKAKEKMRFETLFDKKHEKMHSIFQIISSLEGTRRPSYIDIRNMFRRILIANKVSNEKDFAWLD